VYCYAIYNYQQYILHQFWSPLLDFWNLEKAIITHTEKVGVIKILEKKEEEKPPVYYKWEIFFPFNILTFPSKPTIEYLIIFHFVDTDRKGGGVNVKIETNIPKKQYKKLKVGDKVAVKYVPNPETGIIAIYLDMDEDYE